jgi:hypothetical protein
VGALNYVSLGPVVDAGQPDVFDAGQGEASFVWPCDKHSFVRWTLHDGPHTSSVGVGAALSSCDD